MEPDKETFATWNKVAQLYEDQFMNLNLYDDTYDFICHRINKENPQILDIGCGPGNITNYMLSKFPNFKIKGIDFAPNMIALAKKNNPKASFAIMDSRKINTIKTKFDGIICGFCVPYLSQNETRKFITDCKNLLKMNGWLYISFVEGNPDKSGFQTSSTGDRAYFYFHQLEELKNQLIANDFHQMHVFQRTFEKSINNVEQHTIIIAKKEKN